MLFFVFLLKLLARQVEIGPLETFEFYDKVDINEKYKFKYSCSGDIEVSLYDPKNRLIYSDTTKSAAVFAGITSSGRIKVAVKNRTKLPIDFSYKSPDPNKELLGHLGYIKDVDLVSELARLLDQLIEQQSKQVARTFEHQKMVSSSRFWARILMFSELILTCFGVYFIHKDFVSMFEKKQTL